MEIKEYRTMFVIEDNYWWYVGLRKLVFSYIESIVKNNERLKILDAGCGTGNILEQFNTYRVYGIDFEEEALRFCNVRNLNNLMRASIYDLPFCNNSFDIVISLDVLYCIGVNQKIPQSPASGYFLINNLWTEFPLRSVSLLCCT